MSMMQAIQPKSDQINADDLLAANLTITVASVKFGGSPEQPVSMYFDGSDKAYRPCKSMCRVIVAAWGADAKQYVGKSMTLYCDPTVKFGPLAVGGIRISHMSHIDGPMQMALTATKGVKKAYSVKPLKLDVAVPATDEVGEFVSDILARVGKCADAADVMAITTEPEVIRRRAWLAKNRMPIAKQIDDAITTALDSAGEKRGDPDMGDPFDGADKAGAL